MAFAELDTLRVSDKSLPELEEQKSTQRRASSSVSWNSKNKDIMTPKISETPEKKASEYIQEEDTSALLHVEIEDLQPEFAE